MINPDTFFPAYRQQLGILSQPQVDGLNQLIQMFNADPAWVDDHAIAYALATVKRECANTYHPIGEFGSRVYLSKYYLNSNLRRNLGNIKLSDSWVYKGRGYVQITGRANYLRFERLLQQPLIDQPELALQPDISFQIMTLGMFGGHFTGRKLSEFITSEKVDYYNARRVINGLDHAAEIAEVARRMEACLQSA